MPVPHCGTPTAAAMATLSHCALFSLQYRVPQNEVWGEHGHSVSFLLVVGISSTSNSLVNFYAALFEAFTCCQIKLSEFPPLPGIKPCVAGVRTLVRNCHLQIIFQVILDHFSSEKIINHDLRSHF